MPKIIASSSIVNPPEAVLSDVEQSEIDKEILCYPNKQAVCIEALKIVQVQRGWVSDDAVCAIADYLSMSSAEVDSVATFYNLIFREPVGEKVILLCNSVSCWIMGCETIKKALQERLLIGYGQTSKDNQYTLLPTACLGDCDHAPAMMINKQHFSNVTIENVDAILQGNGECNE